MVVSLLGGWFPVVGPNRQSQSGSVTTAGALDMPPLSPYWQMGKACLAGIGSWQIDEKTTGKWTGMFSKHWQPANGQAFPASIGNRYMDRLIWRLANGQACPEHIGDQIMDMHVRQVLVTSKWTGMSGKDWQPVRVPRCLVSN